MYYLYVAKSKVLISCAFTAQLSYVFVFAEAKTVFSRRGSNVTGNYFDSVPNSRLMLCFFFPFNY